MCHFKKRLLGQRVCAFRCRQSAPSHQWCGCPILSPAKSATQGRGGSSQHISYPKTIPPQVSSSFSSRAVYEAFTQHPVPSPSPLGSQKSRQTDSKEQEKPRPSESPLLQLLLGSRPLAAAVTWGTDASLAQPDSRLTHAPESKGCVVRS